MSNDTIAIFAIALLAIIFSVSPKIGGILIAIIVLGMLLNLKG